MTSDAAAALFDVALLKRAPHLSIACESAEHRAFLADLFALCSPMAGLMPTALMDMQFATQDASFRQDHPAAMRRIVLWDGKPVGRIIIDWDADDRIVGVDIAVRPDSRASRAGFAMLRAWLDVADRIERPCLLNVVANNPARRIYERLGFRPTHPVDPDAAYLTMTRMAAGGVPPV